MFYPLYIQQDPTLIALACLRGEGVLIALYYKI